MVLSRDFPNLKLDHLKYLEDYGVVAAFGSRTCVILNDELGIVQRYLDSNRAERFYCCELVENVQESRALVCLAGETGVIKVVDPRKGLLFGFMRGHTGAIYCLRAFGSFLVSCSEDSTIRLWDVSSMACIGVCGGLFGHKDRVLSVDAMPDGSVIVSAGTDCAIKQWEAREFVHQYLSSGSYAFNHSPLLSFSGIHKCPITRVRYYGSMIVSLNNSVISVVSSNIQMHAIQTEHRLLKNDPVFVGNIDLCGDCKTFDIVGHILLGLSSKGDIYIFDLRNIAKERTPLIVELRLGPAEDFACSGGSLYIASSGSIHKVAIDLSRFE